VAAAVDLHAGPVDNQLAEVGATGAGGLERHLLGRSAGGDAAAAVHGDVHHVLLDVGELEVPAAVDVRGGLLGDEPAEIGAAGAGILDRRLLDLAAGCHSAAAAHGDAQ